MQKNDDLKFVMAGGTGVNQKQLDELANTIKNTPINIEKAVINKVNIPTIIDMSKLKEIPEYKPLDYPPFKYATLIYGVPVIVHENGQLLIIASTTSKKLDLIVKHINSLIKDGLVEVRQVEKESHFIDSKMICDIKKILKVNE